MVDVIPFPFDAYRHHVGKTARWLTGRKPHLIEKNLHAESTRFHAALQNGGLSFEEAHRQAGLFVVHVANRFNELQCAKAKNRPCPVIFIGPVLYEPLPQTAPGGAG